MPSPHVPAVGEMVDLLAQQRLEDRQLWINQDCVALIIGEARRKTGPRSSFAMKSRGRGYANAGRCKMRQLISGGSRLEDGAGTFRLRHLCGCE
ncbi:hypothetical protein DXT96_10185 [Agrobacterium sp. ICMP 6402]|nr:hypothetical protein [Agrobacterium sp. ICMP 6402]